MIAFPAVLLVTVAAFFWSLVKYQTTYVPTMEFLPPRFRDGLNSRFAFPEYVLSLSTPLALQAEYVKSQIGFCLGVLGVATLCLLREKIAFELIVLVAFFLFFSLTIKSWKIYRVNREKILGQ